MTKSTKKWIRGGMETFIHGGTAALTSSITANVIDPKDWHFGSSKSWQLIGMTFLLNGGLRFVQWWNTNPLPPDEDDDNTKISLNPLKPTVAAAAPAVPPPV